VSICTSCGHENREEARFCDECGTPSAGVVAAREQRKTVTVLFCDVTGSTALGERLDPEPLRALLARYFERMSAIVSSHGGTVEKFIGDAVMAVFGVPVLHEDDALRAVRAAVEMRDALPELGVEGRIGVMTGEVVTGTHERLATGDAVNVAARLAQAAQPGEVLIGAETLALVRSAVKVEPVEPLRLKGKAEPVTAYRLVAVTGELERAQGATMIGRVDEFDLLRRAWERSSRDHASQLFTVLGAAGVGKSRLAAEFLAGLEATVVRGRCLSYGEGITYWPVVEVLKQLGTRPEDESAAAVVAALLGETAQPITADEIAWAFRKTLEQAAAERPLVCVFDDLHWAESSLLDLVEHVADWSREAPILLLCMARPELLDRRPGWAGGKMNATAVLLEPLSPQHTDELIEALLAGTELPKAELGSTLRARIRDAAEGNPLFVEEMLALVRASGDGEVVVPPTIQALLAARLDQLDPSERAVLERGAIEGKIFHRSAVEALAPEESQVATQLLALVRKELVRPDRTQLAGDDAFRFRHLLIRDAAYDGLPKSVRAKLHRRFATWLAAHGPDLVELDEILGYHLEQAWKYSVELGQPEDRALAAEARSRLTAAGRRAILRHDVGAAANLLERAAALLAPDEIDTGLELDRIDILVTAGRGEAAHLLANSAAERAAAAGDRVGELCAQIEQGIVRLFLEPEGAAESLAALVDEALPVFDAAGDDLALYTAYLALGEVGRMRARMDAGLTALERALFHARRTGLPHREVRLLPGLAEFRVFGTTPVVELLAWLDAQEASGVRHPAHRVYRGKSLGMLGRFDEARAIATDVLAELGDRGSIILLGLANVYLAGEVERLAGNPQAAVEFGLEGCRLLEQTGERSFLSTAAGVLARALYELDRLEEAGSWARKAAELGSTDDVFTHMIWRQVTAKLLARRGEPAEAERLAHEATALGERSASAPTCSTRRETPTATSPTCSRSAASRRKRSAHCSSQPTATSARGISSRQSERTRDSQSSRPPPPAAESAYAAGAARPSASRSLRASAWSSFQAIGAFDSTIGRNAQAVRP